MKYVLTLIILTVIANAISQDKDKIVLSEESSPIFANQKVQLENSSFSPLYLHVFEYIEDGPVQHINLTEDLKGEIMRINSFKLIEENGQQTWLARLTKENDEKIYLCELKEALDAKEIVLVQ